MEKNKLFDQIVKMVKDENAYVSQVEHNFEDHTFEVRSHQTRHIKENIYSGSFTIRVDYAFSKEVPMSFLEIIQSLKDKKYMKTGSESGWDLK